MIDATIEERDAALATHLDLMAQLPRAGGPPPGYRFASFYDYVLSEGRPSPERMLTAEERAWVKDMTHGTRYPIKQCFANSQQFLLRAINHKPEGWTLRYVEGYCLPDRTPLAILHGWLHLNGSVIDLTLRYYNMKPTRANRFADRAINGMFAGRAYRGIEFTAEDVLAYVVKHKEWGTLIDNYHDRYPLLREKGATL